MLTNREIFDKVKTHLLTQGVRSEALWATRFDEPRCAYRGRDGRKCAIGCLITEEFYDEDLEGHEVGSVPVRDAVTQSLGLGKLGRRTRNMLADLQTCHDVIRVDRWAQQLDHIEKRYL